MVDRWQAERGFKRHRLASLLAVVQTVLVEFAEHADQVLSIADAAGQILWTSGHCETLAAAERVHLTPGALWSEEAAGTNALGTALALDHSVQIFSAEHYKQVLYGWSSAAAPIHAPETGAILGAVSLSGMCKAAHPHGFSLVAAAAHILEMHLFHEAARSDERLKLEYLERARGDDSDASAVVNRHGDVLLSRPNGWLGVRMRLGPNGVPLLPMDGDVSIEKARCGEGFLVRRGGNREALSRPVLRLKALGRDRVDGVVAGRRVRFTPRHGEILVILAGHPEGMDEKALTAAVYSSGAKSVTIRAEISRLRKRLGPIVKTRPYRLAADVQADFLEVERLLERGDHPAATGYGRGPLLPSSTAPAVVSRRRRIGEALAQAGST